ncbi:unnamed protein product, partial [Rotaria magnacalcarata]
MQDSYSVSAAMEKLVHLTSQPYHQLDIRAALSTEIKKAHQASGKFSKISTHVLDTIDANMSEQLENRLQEAKNNYTGERIVLILCNMGSFHWIGILLGFNIDGCIWRAQSFDPVTGSDHLTDKIQTAFSKVYPDIILRVNTLLKHKDHTKSAILTIANLLIATDDAQFSQRNSLNGQQLNSSYDGGRQNNKNKMDQVQAYPTSNEGNISEYDELEKQVAARLKSFNITDIEILPEKIRRSEQRVKDFREDGRHDDAAKEEKHMSELKEMQALSENIAKLKASINCGDGKLRELEQSLASRQAKLKITDLSVLPQKIRHSQERVKDFQDDGRHDDAEKESKHLSDLKEMLTLSQKITKLKASKDSGEGQLIALEESLTNSKIKLKITDLTVLPEKIRRTEERVKDFRDDGRNDDADKETKYLCELKELQALSEKIAQLKNTMNSSEWKLCQLEKSLLSNQEKLNITDLAVLPEKIRRSEQRAKDFRDDGRNDDAERETRFLSDLKELLALSENITKLKSSGSNCDSQSVTLEERLANIKARFNITDLSVLSEKILRSEQRIKDFRDDGRNDDAEKETKYVDELKELQELGKRKDDLKLPNTQSEVTIDSSASKQAEEKIESSSTKTDKLVLTDLDTLHQDLLFLPVCAEKVAMQLLEYFQQIMASQNKSVTFSNSSVYQLFDELENQMDQEEMLSDTVRKNLQDLRRYVDNQDASSANRCLAELLKKIRPLHVQEIQRLIDKAKAAAKVIEDQDVILLIGETGTGKSTTIQFLAGCQMEKKKVEVENGRFLEHVEAVEPIKNPELRRIISSPRNKSETRYITPVTVPLRDIFGPHETGEFIICDAPGFGDTAGPEVDIANGVGVIEAIRGCKSVKILALSSYKSLGDRGQGIQKLTHLLINMMCDIEDRLGSIFYGFTKYPSSSDISALLIDVKISKVDTDPLLRSDNAFVAVLTDMINKTKVGAEKIDPLSGDPKRTIERLKQVRGIMYPRDVFQFSMSENTQACIASQVQRDSSNVKVALKHRNHALVKHYLNNVKTLNDLLEQSSIRDAYAELVRFVSNTINEHCSEVMKKFNRALASQDGLRDEDIREYKSCVEYIEQIQVLRENVGSDLLLPDTLMVNIRSELDKRAQSLHDEELHSVSMRIYLENLGSLKNSFDEFGALHQRCCRDFENRLEKLAQSVHEPINANEFSKVAEIILLISKCSTGLNNNFHGLVEQQYRKTVSAVLEYLSNVSEKINHMVDSIRLSESDVKMIKTCMNILRAARDNVSLQDRIETYRKMFQKQKNDSMVNVKGLNEICNEFIEKVVSYFNQINNRVEQIFEASGDHALEDIENLVNDMDAIRTIPEIESKTAGAYYRTAEKIRGYMQQIQRDVEQMMQTIEQQSGTPNYGKIARSLSRLKSGKWMNRVSPGAYDISIHRITEELIQYFHQLEDRLMKLDLSLKYPENICVAQEIFDQIESLSVLERTIPELKKSKEAMIKRFLEYVQATFDRIQVALSLQDINVYQMKKELKNLEQIKQEYENQHPASMFLRKQNFSDISQLNAKLEELKQSHTSECAEAKIEQGKIESQLTELRSINDKYDDLCLSTGEQDECKQNKKTNAQADNYLISTKYSNIDNVREAIIRNETFRVDLLQTLKEQRTKYEKSLSWLESVKNEYEQLLNAPGPTSSEAMKLVRERSQISFESLEENIAEKKKMIDDREKSKLSHDFSKKPDASTADTAIAYINNCEKISDVSVRKSAADTGTILKKFISEYGNHLNERIRKAWADMNSITKREEVLQVSQDLELCLEELSGLSKFTNVFVCIGGDEKVGYWHRKLQEEYRDMSREMENCKESGNNEELRRRLIRAQLLIASDHFCASTRANHAFGDLYRKYQVEITKDSKETYRNVLSYLLQADYENAELELWKIDEKTCSAQDQNQMKEVLQTAIKKLLHSTRLMINNIDFKGGRKENNDIQEQKLIENMEKIHTCATKGKLIGMLDKTHKESLEQFEKQMTDKLDDVIKKGIEFIESCIGNDDYLEAEQCMEQLIRVQRELMSHFTMGEGTSIDDVKMKVRTLDTSILQRHDLKAINNYHIKSPRALLDKLLKANQEGYAKYRAAHDSILSEIEHNFEMALTAARTASFEERLKALSPLTCACRFLPKSLESKFKPEITKLHEIIVEEEKAYKRDLKNFIENGVEDEQTIKKVGQLIEQYSLEKREAPLEMLTEGMKQKLSKHEITMQTSLADHQIKAAAKSLKYIIFYKNSVHDVSEVNQIYTHACSSMCSSFTTYMDTLTCIFNFEQSQKVNEAFDNILLYLEVCQDTGLQELLPQTLSEKSRGDLKSLHDSWHRNSEAYNTAIEKMAFNSLHEVMMKSKPWDELLQKVKSCPCQHILLKEFLEKMQKILCYDEMKSILQGKIADLKKNFSVELISDETTRFEKVRNQFFQNLRISIDIFNEINLKFQNLLTSLPDVKHLEGDLKKKVIQISDQLIEVASKKPLSMIDTDDFRKFYDHLVSFDKYARFPDVDVRTVLVSAEKLIFDGVTLLSKELATLKTDIEQIAGVLMKMKFLAENLSMFDTKINAKINEALDLIKTQQGTTGVEQLTMILEGTDLGSRLIAEHPALSGEDWRKRREKMQKQDDLKYVLDELRGDDIVKDVLESRYKSFRKTYDNLVANTLAAFNQKTETEPNIDVLISQTKFLLGKIVHTPTSVNWDQSVRDQIPDLLAHIFAIWTAKNTQHYNTARGIDAGKAYLLMPHVAQVLAIFRILGIGHKKNVTVAGYNVPGIKRLSSSLMNNLVQVGTGEGKSVIMAVTACVFALIGVDVSCSCYSEYLSTRDKNDFASVFRALGIDERIEYGTFNKLCENLLNEQCNVREKVRDMILKNKNAVDIVQQTERIRPKVLLIDEVDVFLSEKYYGGLYTPAVYLRDPKITTIKAFLDSVWINKNARTLNGIKALPAYKQCAAQFSNWMFLFDEAIKDMLAALRSFQASTYIVQNDRI